MPRGSQKNSVVWRHFQVEERDTVSHRRKGRCLHCLTNFHDCRFDSLQKHLLYQCNAIPESLKEELGKSIEVSKPEPTTATKQSKRKAKEVETKPDERYVFNPKN